MRKFASVQPRIWQTDLKAVRGDMEALAVHYHLTTSSHANMLGLYYLPVPYISHEIGCLIEGASKGLQSLIRAKLCSYDFDRDLVWIHEMAADQIAPELSPRDKRVKGIADQLAMLPICQITLGFYARYRSCYHLYDERNLADFELELGVLPEAPSKPLRSKEKEKDLGEEKGPFGSGGQKSQEQDKETMFTPYPIPTSPSEGRAFLIGKGVPQSSLDECVRAMLGGNFSPYDLEGILSDARNAA